MTTHTEGMATHTEGMATHTEGLRAVIWTRVSTREQTTENQLPLLKAAAAERGYRVVRHIDLHAVSAYRQETKTYTMAINKLYAAAESGAFDVVLVTALDRITRKGGDSLRTILTTLDDNSVSVVSLRESFTEHQTGRIGRLVRNIIIEVVGFMGEDESAKISERTLEGLRTARTRRQKTQRAIVRARCSAGRWCGREASMW